MDRLGAWSPARVLVLAPHPDDFDAIGVTMLRLRDRGCRIDLAVLTSGASGVLEGFCSPDDWETRSRCREREQLDSLRFFGEAGPETRFLRLLEDEEGHPIEDPGNEQRIARLIEGQRPDWAFLPHGNDTNAGHRRTFRMFRRIAARRPARLIALYARDPKTIGMSEHVYTIFGDEEAAWKAELLRQHRSQHQRNLETRGHGLDARILDVNRQSGRSCPVAGNTPAPLYAEAFEIEQFG